jgi:hypothetical protein
VPDVSEVGFNRGSRSWSVLLVTLTLLTLGMVSAPHGVAAPPDDFQTSLVVGDGLNGPSGFEIAPDGRIFILERSGKIKIVKNGELLPTPFADLPSEDTGDRGLIGIAFDPDFGGLKPLRLRSGGRRGGQIQRVEGPELSTVGAGADPGWAAASRQQAPIKPITSA